VTFPAPAGRKGEVSKMGGYIRVVTEEDVDRLLVENKELKVENAELKAENKRLKKAVGPLMPGGWKGK